MDSTLGKENSYQKENVFHPTPRDFFVDKVRAEEYRSPNGSPERGAVTLLNQHRLTRFPSHWRKLLSGLQRLRSSEEVLVGFCDETLDDDAGFHTPFYKRNL